MFTIFTTMFSFLKGNTLMLKLALAGIVIAFIIYKVVSFTNHYTDLLQQRDKLVVDLRSTQEKLAGAAAIANNNAKLLEDEKKKSAETVDHLNKKHAEDLSRKETYTIIKEKTYYEKDSDFISPVLSNTIDRLYNKTRTTN